MAVEVGEIIVSGGVFGIQRQRLFPLLLRAVLVVEVVQEAAVGDARAGVVGMALDEVIIGFADGREAVADAPLQVGARHAAAFGRRLVVVANPLVHLGLGRIVSLQQLLVFLFHRLIRAGHGGRRRIGGPGDEVVGCRQRAGGHEDAEQAN